MRKYNHRAKITGWQPCKLLSVVPGMILEFNYSGDDIHDPKPLVLVIWRDYAGRRGGKNKIHGINLNYLTEHRVQKLFSILGEKYQVGKQDPQNPEDRDEWLHRNLIQEDFTRIKLQTYKEDRGTEPRLSKLEAKRQIKLIYEKILKRKLFIPSTYDVYRSYYMKNMGSIKIVNYRIG